MRGRLLALACLLVLAGCSGTPAGAPEPTETVTPASVPSPETDGRNAAPDRPGIENGTVDGDALVARHVESLSVPYRRVVTVRVETAEGTLLVYSENLTVFEEASLRRRVYEGPATDRFVPGARNATTAREVRYRNGTTATRRQFVDGRARREDAPPPVAPALEDGRAGLVALLDGAVVVGESPPSGYLVSTRGIDERTVSERFTDVRDGEVRATVLQTGPIARLTVRYDARLGDRPVTVTQEVYWTGPITRELG